MVEVCATDVDLHGTPQTQLLMPRTTYFVPLDFDRSGPFLLCLQTVSFLLMSPSVWHSLNPILLMLALYVQDGHLGLSSYSAFLERTQITQVLHQHTEFVTPAQHAPQKNTFA